MSQKQFILKAEKDYSRLDQFLSLHMPDISRSQLAKWIKDGHILVNDSASVKKSLPIETGDRIHVTVPALSSEDEKVTYQPSISIHDIKLYEDQYLLVIDKPSGISIHPGSGAKEETILDIFRHDYPQISEIQLSVEDEQRPGIVHRLDKETSGVLILAKDIITMRRLQKQFKRREVKKTYIALVAGNMRYKNGTIDAPLTRSSRQRTKFIVADTQRENAFTVRDAITRYHLVRQYESFSLVKAFPYTGRTHQIRVHFAHLGNPVLGDALYGKNTSFPRLALHAYRIEFIHPITQAHLIAFSPAPPVFRQYLKDSR